MPIAKGPDVAVAGIVYRRKHNYGEPELYGVS